MQHGLYHVPLSRIRLNEEDLWPEQLGPGRLQRQLKYQGQHGRPPSPVHLSLTDEGTFLVGDGRRRVEAARRLRRRTIPAWVEAAEATVVRHRRASERYLSPPDCD